MLLYVLDLLGVAVFAVSGAVAAGRRRLDLLGVVVLAAVTAVGGGTIRDLLLDRNPIFWLADVRYLVVIIVAALATVVWARWASVPGATLDVADAFGLALFSVSGTQVAERAGLPMLSCMLLGAMTGSAGGVVRDVLTAQVPLVLRRGSLYVTAAIAGSGLYLALVRLGVSGGAAALQGMIVVVAVRLAALWWGLALPVFELESPAEREAAERSERGPAA